MINLSHIRIAVCAAILFTLLAHPSSTSACSCGAGVTVTEEFAQDSAVFTGKVIRIVDNYFPYFFTADNILYKIGRPTYFFDQFLRNDDKRLNLSIFFKVLNSWKGVEKTLVEVNTGRGDSDCGYSFVNGQEYLIYANFAYGIPDNYWVTSICTRNAMLHDASEDLKYLNSLPELPLKFALPIPWAETDSITVVIIVIIGVIVSVMRGLRMQREREV
ncbi:MAG TPA: hypothetical protein VFQ23_05930 [Anaerolineales bacterium]|nr:hypothetical protein [Anaerolineales bacterium]